MFRFSCIIVVLLFVLNLNSYSQVKSNSKLKPKWTTESLFPSNSSYKFYVSYVEVSGDIEIARGQSKAELCRLVQREEQISVLEDYTVNSEDINDGNNIVEAINKVYSLKVESEGKIINLNYLKLDEYWRESYVDGVRKLEFYTLYAVARPGVVPQFDDVYFTDKYGISAMARSLIPGWGQIYKGSIAKGVSFLVGEALCISGIILCESQRASYHKKMKEQPRFAKTYSTKSDNWENGRNICIGASAALYVYNLIDAVATKGARRAIVKKKNTDFALVPMVDSQNNGISFIWKF